jgi:hypothetical protein
MLRHLLTSLLLEVLASRAKQELCHAWHCLELLFLPCQGWFLAWQIVLFFPSPWYGTPPMIIWSKNRRLMFCKLDIPKHRKNALEWQGDTNIYGVSGIGHILSILIKWSFSKEGQKYIMIKMEFFLFITTMS